GEGFLGRWSRRKRGLEAESLAEARPAPPVAAPATPQAPAQPPMAAQAPPLAEFDPASLPPLESLGPGSDFGAFLKPEVPALLRQAAMRRMWSLDPAIRDYVGPADYAWDFNAPDGVPGFSLELGGELRELLARAIGAPAGPEGQEPGAAEGSRPPAAPEALADMAPARLPEELPEGLPAEPAAGMEQSGPPGLSPVPLSPVQLRPAQLPLAPPPLSGAPELPLPAALPEKEASPPPRRRHGGAVPQ
ncbi:DUF3306 domain-containing protein, partial [Teichococcus rhizosphaerae]|uniref:DUF3306 domain-containing protein n=1 Tax=Teichococcus rhizosphaerae TaxID=1335062 RepID=UPI0011451D0A